MEKEYLGDGVYASFTADRVKLTTDDGWQDNIIFLESEVAQALVNYIKRVMNIQAE